MPKTHKYSTKSEKNSFKANKRMVCPADAPMSINIIRVLMHMIVYKVIFFYIPRHVLYKLMHEKIYRILCIVAKKTERNFDFISYENPQTVLSVVYFLCLLKFRKSNSIVT